MVGPIKSDTATADDAVSQYGNSENVSSKSSSLGESNLSGMKNVVEVSNKIVGDMITLESAIKRQADKFPQLASAIKERDKQDAKNLLTNTWGW